jgi:cytochrome c556
MLHSMLRFIVPFAFAVACIGCRNTSDTSPPVKERESTPPEYADWEPPPMEVHYQKALNVHQAVVQGDLDVAKATATWIAENTVKDTLSASWRGKVPPVVDAANAIVSAEDLDAAAKATATLGQACGSCHADMSVELVAPQVGIPPEGEDTASHMRRHQWAVERMWHGLIAPSDESWNAGATALAEAPLQVVSDTKGEQKEGQGVADQVHGLAAAAAKQTVPEERAATYGELLASCAACHEGRG